ncbi:DUF2065 domain-containing protein [Viridibacterium curvum]|uniref:DUF2065 domain-containing protein n=1 Tax=Viridibacterium curvum TaxID=1101404 RepID=A0ABP9R1M9_9RHOO
MLVTLLTALAVMLVLEGLFPLAFPSHWRKMFERLTRLADGQVRFMGLMSMLTGLILLFVVL